MKYNDESHKQWVVRQLTEIETELKHKAEYLDIEHLSALSYAIGFLIGIGWADK